MHVYLKRELVESFYYVDILMALTFKWKATNLHQICFPKLLSGFDQTVMFSIYLSECRFERFESLLKYLASNQWHAK